MMKYYVVDAFADKLFEGNPAGVCVLDSPLSDKLMQLIAMENNLSETAFAVKEDEGYGLRWFTPGGEIDLCGHATLATGFVIMLFVESDKQEINFQTLGGKLTVQKNADLFEMDFPAYELKRITVTDQMAETIGVRPLEAWMGRDLVCILDTEEAVINASVDGKKAMELDGLLLHLTAKGREYDCVTRSFAPKLNVAEDPVCGSGHCHVAPLWAEKLQKNGLIARQASERGGTLYCTVTGDRVQLSGKAVLYSIAELQLEGENR